MIADILVSMINIATALNGKYGNRLHDTLTAKVCKSRMSARATLETMYTIVNIPSSNAQVRQALAFCLVIAPLDFNPSCSLLIVSIIILKWSSSTVHN